MESFEFKFVEWWFIHKNQQIPTEKECVVPGVVRHRENENLVEFSI